VRCLVPYRGSIPSMTARSPRPLPSVEYLRKCFDYNHETGELRWRKRPMEHFALRRTQVWHNNLYAGELAGGARPSGYRLLYIGGVRCYAHRVIWKLVTGGEPPARLDHHDRDPRNNRWSNLRPATPVEQNWNKGLLKVNRSGFRGVHRCRKVWVTQITVGSVARHLGSYNTAEEAAAVYEAEARQLHGDFYCEPDYATGLASVTPKRRPRRERVSGVSGVYQSGKWWQARVKRDNRWCYIGNFKTIESAHEAYKRAVSTGLSQNTEPA
jgi:hypothetical protein